MIDGINNIINGIHLIECRNRCSYKERTCYFQKMSILMFNNPILLLCIKARFMKTNALFKK